MPSRGLLKQLNHHLDVRHVRDDLRQGKLGDPGVYQLAATQDRIVVTFNGRDFRPLVGASPKDPGVIDVPMGWTATQIDTKLMALTRIILEYSPNYPSIPMRESTYSSGGAPDASSSASRVMIARTDRP
jgi:hypothetical protein